MTLSSARTYELKQSDVQLQPFISQDLGHPLEINERRRERQKWRTTLFSFVILACAVLVINTGFLAWTVRTRGTTDGVGVLYEASCEATKRANIGVHLVINILSSALLGASNYCMQCLSAPTRSEVDKAHNTGNWLDIGIPSLRNVVSSSFGTRKKVCWWILAISSLPLHPWWVRMEKYDQTDAEALQLQLGSVHVSFRTNICRNTVRARSQGCD
jgi:hypothetical protein